MDNPYHSPAAAVAAPVTASRREFRDPARRTLACRILLYCTIALTLASMAYSGLQYALMGQVEAGLLDYDEALQRLGMLALLLALPQILVNIGTIVAVAMWIHRMAWNAHAMAGSRHLDCTPGWAVGWYFIPIANLFKPYQAMKEIWQASRQPLRPDQAAVPLLFPLWWTLWLIAGAANQVSLRMSFKADTVYQMSDAAVASIVCDVLSLALCVVFLGIVARLSHLQLAWPRTQALQGGAAQTPPSVPPQVLDQPA